MLEGASCDACSLWSILGAPALTPSPPPHYVQVHVRGASVRVGSQIIRVLYPLRAGRCWAGPLAEAEVRPRFPNVSAFRRGFLALTSKRNFFGSVPSLPGAELTREALTAGVSRAGSSSCLSSCVFSKSYYLCWCLTINAGGTCRGWHFGWDPCFSLYVLFFSISSTLFAFSPFLPCLFLLTTVLSSLSP